MARNSSWNLTDWLIMAREEKFNVKSLARRLGMSARQFERLTLKWLGQTPKSLINQERIVLMSVALFSHGAVKSAAGHLHLNQYYFTRKFRDFYGMTPREFLVWIHKHLRTDGQESTPDQVAAAARDLLQNVAKSQINVAKSQNSAIPNAT